MAESPASGSNAALLSHHDGPLIEPPEKGLKGGALGLVASIVIGVASTAPAYSLAASLGFVVATANGDGIVGIKAPAIMLLAFVPMFFIAIAYQELNKAEPDCGTTFTWAARAFGPRSGWMGGWGIIAADVIVMANLAQIAGSYSFSLVGADGLADSTFWSTVAGVIWIALMTYICYRGIEVSARLQYVLLAVEVVVLIGFAGFALAKVYGGSAPEGSLHPSVSWLWPSRPDHQRPRQRHADRRLHLLGLGLGSRVQRGMRGPESDTRPGSCALDRAAARHLRTRQRRHGGVRRHGVRRSGA